MVKVKKRSECFENFNKAKLKASMTKAGAESTDATEIADKIASKVKPGTTTTVIRRWVISELRPRDSKACNAYESYAKPAKKYK